MRTVTLGLRDWVRIGEFRISVVDVDGGVVRWEVLVPEGVPVRYVATTDGLDGDAMIG